MRQGAGSEEIAEPKEAKAGDVDEESQNVVATDANDTTDTESSSDKDTNETSTDAVTKLSDDQSQATDDQTVDLNVLLHSHVSFIASSFDKLLILVLHLLFILYILTIPDRTL